MKTKSLISALALSATAMFASTSATAAAIYINPLAGPGTATAPFTSFSLNWTALSSYADTNGNGQADAGESVVDTVVRNYSEAGVNVLNNYGDIGLIPQISGSGTGYGTTWGLYFDYTLNGTVLSASGSSIIANYTSGFIDIYYDNFVGRGPGNAGRDVIADTRVMRIEVDGSGGDIANFLLFGEVRTVVNDTFFLANGTDFADLLLGGLVIETRVDTNLDTNNVPSGPAGGTLTRTSTLDGSARFDVPEPGIIALLGLGLIGIGAARRYKKIA